MVTAAGTMTVDQQIALLKDEARELAEVLAEREIPENQIDDWVYDWPNEMVHASRLETSYRAGEMTDGQVRRYTELKEVLRGIAPLLSERLDLSVPAEVLV